MGQSMKVTLNDIAKRLNISTAAVSRALNDLPGVSDELRMQAKETAGMMGYTKHLRPAAAESHERSMKFIAVLYGPVGGNIMAILQPGIAQTIRKRGYHQLTHLVDIFRELNTDAAKESFLNKIAAETGMVGVLACYMKLSDILIAKLQKRGIPVVLLENETEFGRCVTINHVKASHRAVTRMIEFGRKHIGCIVPAEGDRVWDDRLTGYRRALKDGGLPYDPSLIVHENWVGVKPGGLATGALLREHPETDAILYASDSMACGGMKMLRDLGRVVPDDVAVIGFDDEDYDVVLQPSLSSIRQPIRKMGEQGAQLLLDSIEKGDFSHRRVELDTELMVRGSCSGEYDEETWS
jgi:LacI family transcriptional regulator